MKKTTVVAFAASLLASFIAYSLLNSSQPSSAPFENLGRVLGWSSAGRSNCRDHPCLDTSNGLRTVNSHVGHIVGAWDFIEGLGHPRHNTFVPIARQLGPPRNKEWPPFNRDPLAQSFLDLTKKFLWMGYSLDSTLGLFLHNTLDLFQAMSPLLNRSRRTLATFEAKFNDSPNPRHSYIEIDKTFNSTVTDLTASLKMLCATALEKSESLPPLALNVSILGSELTTQLESELARVREALNLLPWWDTWTVRHWAGKSATLQYRPYLRFFEKNAATLRTLREAALAIHSNVVGFRDYCAWYNADGTIGLINDEPPDGIVTAKSITRTIENLQIRVKDASNAGKKDGLPGWLPRLVGPYPLRIP
ncbi:hypothetical protein C8R46DRAFT_1359833 [Mycena filopes]|nr:hypothetical protein C8R46DRAFT_1359833 [Mycena filopes]